MQQTISNHIKALLFPEDIRNEEHPLQEKCFTVQHYQYTCSRNRNEIGTPCSFTNSVLLKCSLKTISDESGKIFYELMKSNRRYSFSFVFNATFNQYRRLDYCDDSMIVNGFIVDVQENLETIDISILLSDITYVGKESDKTLYIIH